MLWEGSDKIHATVPPGLWEVEHLANNEILKKYYAMDIAANMSLPVGGDLPERQYGATLLPKKFGR